MPQCTFEPLFTELWYWYLLAIFENLYVSYALHQFYIKYVTFKIIYGSNSKANVTLKNCAKQLTFWSFVSNPVECSSSSVCLISATINLSGKCYNNSKFKLAPFSPNPLPPKQYFQTEYCRCSIDQRFQSSLHRECTALTIPWTALDPKSVFFHSSVSHVVFQCLKRCLQRDGSGIKTHKIPY